MRWLLVLLLMTGPAAGAQAICGERARIVAHLESEFKEQRTGVGLAGEYMIETFRSPDGATFTILQTGPNMISCVMAAGEAWQTIHNDPGA